MASDLKLGTGSAGSGSSVSMSTRSALNKITFQAAASSAPPAATAAAAAAAAPLAAAGHSGEGLLDVRAAALKIGNNPLLVLDSKVVETQSLAPGVVLFALMVDGVLQPPNPDHKLELLCHMLNFSLCTTLLPELCREYEAFYAHSWAQTDDGTLLLVLESNFASLSIPQCEVPRIHKPLGLPAPRASPPPRLIEPRLLRPASHPAPAQPAPKRTPATAGAAAAPRLGTKTKQQLSRGRQDGAAGKLGKAATRKGAAVQVPRGIVGAKKPRTLTAQQQARINSYTTNQTDTQLGQGHGTGFGEPAIDEPAVIMCRYVSD